jgi:hypothetical protein
MPIDPDAARTFIHTHGRLLDRHVFTAAFDDGDPAAVIRALAAYQNPDGGFGHGLEPDKRCPSSQPLDVEVAFEYLVTIGATPPAEFLRAFDFLAGIADERGWVPVLLPTIAGYPRAAHWAASDEYPPDVNPTAAIVGHAHALGVCHPWVDLATESTFTELERGTLPADAHSLLCITRLLEHAPDPERAAPIAERVAAAVPQSDFFRAQAAAGGYGLDPLDFAPRPTSMASAWFDAASIQEHLDALERRQLTDGGWPIEWEPPGPASTCEWRAMRTLDALRTLRAHGRITPA